MKKKNLRKFVSYGGLLSTITVIFQTAPIFFPPIGLLLSPFSTLPIAVATSSSISLGISIFISSSIIISIISLQEYLIFCFTTGLLGIIIGTFINRCNVVVSIIASTISLTLGIIILTYLINIDSFSDFAKSIPPIIVILIYFVFSFIYSIISNIIINKILKYLNRIEVNFKL